MASLFPEQYRLLLARIVEARKQAGITQTDLAEQLRRPQSFVSKYESGERRLDPVEFYRIAVLLNADPVAILTESVRGSDRAKHRRRKA